MLKFLTQKLRTHSLNEESVPEKVDEHDSGTESDEDWEHPDLSMASRGSSVSPAVDSEGADSELCSSCRPTPAHRDPHYDHHSSEEELEVINNIPHDPAYRCETSPEGGRRIGCGQLPEKRKWAQIACTGRRHENDENTRSSDGEECAAGGPVRFRTSPPLEALKPARPLRPRHRAASPLALHNGCGCSAPPHKVPHYDRSPNSTSAAASPRKRSRHTPRRHHPPTQRPCLDFDKMQQLKVHAVTAWRHGGGEHGGELSVFCW